VKNGTSGAGHTNGRLAIELAPGAEGNAFATMLADLVRQNLESKPHKRKDFDALDGTVALVADDADVALTLEFKAAPRRGDGGRLTLHDGIKGIPDVAVRGSADSIMALSNVPLTRPLGLPVPTDRMALEVLRGMVRASWTGELRIYGMFGNMGLLSRLTRVMSVNG
jgi:hypothetical protein